MNYGNIFEGIFIERPNRFIAKVLIGGEEKVCHVKNTGRCRELLTDGARVIVEKIDSSARKTEYDLIAVYKNGQLINIDSGAPNKVFGEWVEKSGYFGELSLIKPEHTYKNSRFDFYLEGENKKIFVEVKGVTLEKDGVVRFPDAPTERGTKHLRELMTAVRDGYEAYVFFIIQMRDCLYFTPNVDTDKRFSDTLTKASAAGVNIRALCCDVTPNSLSVKDFVEVKI